MNFKKFILLIPLFFLIACQATSVESYGNVEITNEVPPLLAGKQISDELDVGVGLPVPTATFTNPDGTITTISPDSDQAKMIFFVAHWCPHCEDELSDLIEVLDNGDFANIETHIVLTSINPTQANFPPSNWIEELGFNNLENVFIHYDNEDNLASEKFGSDGKIPYTMIVTKDGFVVFRAIGSAGVDGLRENYTLLSNNS